MFDVIFAHYVCRGDYLKRFTLLMFGLLISLPQGYAWADLMLYPTRIVFEKNQRTAQLELINNGLESATYRISVVNRRMNEDGEFMAVDSSMTGQLFADELLRYSPRQVVLAPGASQTIRILLRKPVDLPIGEYRSHLQFDRIPEARGVSSRYGKAPKLALGDMGVQLVAMIGVSIPVIVRQGETAATVTMTGLELLKPVPGQAAMLALVLQRSGNRSVYGDVVATFTPQGGSAQSVGKAGGVAVYFPNPLRRVRLPLELPPGLVLAHGTLHVTFRERAEMGAKLLAEKAIELP